MNKTASRNKSIKKDLNRVCIVCSKKLKIKVKANGSYTGGHYFGTVTPKNIEYWECGECCIQ